MQLLEIERGRPLFIFLGKKGIEMRIAAYCRVSTAKEEQLDSLANQKEFFEAYAQTNGYELVHVYADEGISGTQMRKREQFQALLRDAVRHHFDLVVVKDISRFARNTVDFLQSVRALKELGVNTRFLTANMDSLGESEFVLTLFGALAQEESANLSRRVKFGKCLNAQKGRVPRLLYGYHRVDNFQLAICPEEAQVVRKIYALYVEQGLGCRTIAQKLNGLGYVTKQGCPWTPSAVHRILINPIYCGHHVNHKYEVENYLTGKRKKLPPQEQFHHPRPQWAIVTPEQFAQAQQQRQQRAQAREPGQSPGRYSARHQFSGLIVCSECGRSFCRKTYTYANTRVYWKCWGNDQGLCGNRTKIEEAQLVEAIRDHVSGCMTHLEGWKQRVVDGVLDHISGAPQEETELERLEQRKRRYERLYANGIIQLEQLQQELAQLQTRKNALQKSRAGERRNTASILEQLEGYMRWEGLERADVAKLVEKITADGRGEVQIFLRTHGGTSPVDRDGGGG